MAPNILYLHSHDTGRHVQPYGVGVRTPRIQRLAEEGVIFRQAFAAAPTCSGSRAALATGQYPHVNGMVGLAHRGFGIHDMRRHLIHALRPPGYYTVLVGEQHIAGQPVRHRLRPAAHRRHAAPRRRRRARRRRAPARRPAAALLPLRRLLRDAPRLLRPRLAAGRQLVRAAAEHPRHARDPCATWRRSRPARRSSTAASASSWTPSRAPGSTATRSSSARPTTACPFPGAKATLTDRGTGVMLILRGPGGFRGGKAVDALVQHLDVYPTVCELAGVETPAHVQGRSLLPLVRGEARRGARRALHRDDVPRRLRPAAGGAHPALEVHPPLRRPRCTRCWRTSTTARARTCCSRPAGPTSHRAARGPARPAARPERGRRPRRATPPHAHVLDDLRGRLDRWMEETDDPLRHGDVPGAARGRVQHAPTSARPASRPSAC